MITTQIQRNSQRKNWPNGVEYEPPSLKKRVSDGKLLYVPAIHLMSQRFNMPLLHATFSMSSRNHHRPQPHPFFRERTSICRASGAPLCVPRPPCRILECSEHVAVIALELPDPRELPPRRRVRWIPQLPCWAQPHLHLPPCMQQAYSIDHPCRVCSGVWVKKKKEGEREREMG